MNQQEFKDRVAYLFIEARINAVLAEATSDDGKHPQADKPTIRKRYADYRVAQTAERQAERSARQAAAAAAKPPKENSSTMSEELNSKGFEDKHMVPQKTFDHMSKKFAETKARKDREAEVAAAKANRNKGIKDSTINQDFMDRLINIIMEKRVDELSDLDEDGQQLADPPASISGFRIKNFQKRMAPRIARPGDPAKKKPTRNPGKHLPPPPPELRPIT